MAAARGKGWDLGKGHGVAAATGKVGIRERGMEVLLLEIKDMFGMTPDSALLQSSNWS